MIPGSAKGGVCESECAIRVLAYPFLFLLIFVSLSIAVPLANTSIRYQLRHLFLLHLCVVLEPRLSFPRTQQLPPLCCRCVPDNMRAIAFGVQWCFSRFLGLYMQFTNCSHKVWDNFSLAFHVCTRMCVQDNAPLPRKRSGVSKAGCVTAHSDAFFLRRRDTLS